MLFTKHLGRAMVLALIGSAGGCTLAPQGGMTDRCARLMHEAYPGAEIRITGQEAAATGITAIVAKVEGERTDLPAGSLLPRKVAVECRFDHDVLTGFRWTKGPNR